MFHVSRSVLRRVGGHARACACACVRARACVSGRAVSRRGASSACQHAPPPHPTPTPTPTPLINHRGRRRRGVPLPPKVHPQGARQLPPGAAGPPLQGGAQAAAHRAAGGARTRKGGRGGIASRAANDSNMRPERAPKHTVKRGQTRARPNPLRRARASRWTAGAWSGSSGTCASASTGGRASSFTM